MEASEQQMRHLLDLCRRAERTGQRMTSGFCSPAEQEDFLTSPESRKFVFTFEGGYTGAERRILAAGESEEALPIAVLEIKPLSEKFAEELSHRDYLGAILGLGIERSLVGDILVREKRAMVFCLESIADFLCQSLTQVRRTSVSVSHALELLECLSGKYVLCAASNGPYRRQMNRLHLVGMDRYFDYFFISERIGTAKPSSKFYNSCFAQLRWERLPDLHSQETIIIGIH